MTREPNHVPRSPRVRLKRIAYAVNGRLAVALLYVLRRFDRKRIADIAGRWMRRIGPWLKEHRLGRENLVAAFPEKTPAEIEHILGGAWDNLGRIAVEFAHLDRLTFLDAARPGPADIVFSEESLARYAAIRADGQPSLIFAAHLANWELPALGPPRFGVDACVLYRPPGIPAVADAIFKIRTGLMPTLVPSSFVAPVQLANALERGSHVGMLVDQYESRGVDVMFFGRPCKASPLIAQLARHTGCPIRGVRIVRLPDGNSFSSEVTEPLDLPRDSEGLVDVKRTMQAITAVIEGWVREHPEQWLWLHRRWR